MHALISADRTRTALATVAAAATLVGGTACSASVSDDSGHPKQLKSTTSSVPVTMSSSTHQSSTTPDTHRSSSADAHSSSPVSGPSSSVDSAPTASDGTTSGTTKSAFTTARIRSAVLHAPHPGLSGCSGDAGHPDYRVLDVVEGSFAPDALYAVASTTCADAASLAPTDVVVVEPYPTDPQVMYTVAKGNETHDGYRLYADRITVQGNAAVIVYTGARPGANGAAKPVYFKQVAFLGAKGVQSRTGYTATTAPQR